ncbi:MAG TPA: serine/threonine-protein kinase, partial [Nannocystis sp.]
MAEPDDPVNAPGLRLGALLGSGAVATVARVESNDGRVFAGKVLHASHGQDSAATQRFAQEAALLRGVVDPNIVTVFGVAEIEGKQVLLLELVEGPTLAQLIAREAPLAESRLARLAAGVARGLARAHAAGVIHRDLKPANILVAAGDVPKIADFGMARATSLAGVERSALAVLGTPDYMAPESLDPLAVDTRSDLYALGCILFEMATGRPPHTGATAFGVIEAHRKAITPALGEGFSPPLRALVASLLAKSPADRPQAATQVAALLEQIADGHVTTLAVVAEHTPGGPACAGCGQPLVPELAVCMHCGLAVARAEPGRWTVLVAGPGEPGDKLDSALRARLIGWIAGNPGLGVVAGSLEKTIPRVPFTLLTRVSEASGRSIVAALARLGLEAEVVQGGALRSVRMRKKAGALIGRTLAVAFASSAGLMSNKYILF